MKRRDAFAFFANPFVVLADVMVSLFFIISLFLLSSTVYSEQMELIAQRDARRHAIAQSLSQGLRSNNLISDTKSIGNEAKYQLGGTVEVEDDGTIQRFRFLQGLLDFKPNSTEFVSPEASRVLKVFGWVLLKNRSRIKSIVIEGHASSGEKITWSLSQQRAEAVRALWEQERLTQNVTENWRSPVFRFLAKRKLWDARRFHEWHLQEYQARRINANGGSGVLPAAWIITSGRGDQVRRLPVVEFKVEYTERDAPPLDDYIAMMSPSVQNAARAEKITQ